VSDTLARICDDKRAHVAGRKAEMPEFLLRQRIEQLAAPRGFARALGEAVAAGRYGLIAEIKKASPSKGLIRADFEPMARTLANLGCERAWVVHGSDGMDELTLTGPSFVASLENGQVKTFEVGPEDAGLNKARAEDLKGGDGAANALSIRALFAGQRGPLRDVVLYNAAAALLIASKAKDLKEGVALAGQSIDQGRATAALDRLVAITNAPAPAAAAAP